MLISFAMMGVGIVGLAITPSYARIGVLAPILVVTWRLCQGFALGGEVGPTTAYLIEAAPQYRRGLYAAWQNVSQNLAAIVGGSMGVILSSLIGAADLDDWGWRLAFGLGALILPIGLILRRNLPEHTGCARASDAPPAGRDDAGGAFSHHCSRPRADRGGDGFDLFHDIHDDLCP